MYLKYKKRQVIVSLRVITTVFIMRHSNVSLENGKKPLCPVPKENHANARWSASWTESTVPPPKKNWKAMT